MDRDGRCIKSPMIRYGRIRSMNHHHHQLERSASDVHAEAQPDRGSFCGRERPQKASATAGVPESARFYDNYPQSQRSLDSVMAVTRCSARPRAAPKARASADTTRGALHALHRASSVPVGDRASPHACIRRPAADCRPLGSHGRSRPAASPAESRARSDVRDNHGPTQFQPGMHTASVRPSVRPHPRPDWNERHPTPVGPILRRGRRPRTYRIQPSLLPPAAWEASDRLIRCR